MPRQDSGEPYFRVDSVEAREMLETDPDNTVVVDVRRPDEWVTGHAAGAIHIEIDDLMGRLDELPQDKKLLFICAAGVRSGSGVRIRHGWRIRPRQPVQRGRRHSLLDRRRQPDLLRGRPVRESALSESELEINGTACCHDRLRLS